jgi:hypothetical protein
MSARTLLLCIAVLLVCCTMIHSYVIYEPYALYGDGQLGRLAAVKRTLDMLGTGTKRTQLTDLGRMR